MVNPPPQNRHFSDRTSLNQVIQFWEGSNLITSGIGTGDIENGIQEISMPYWCRSSGVKWNASSSNPDCWGKGWLTEGRNEKLKYVGAGGITRVSFLRWDLPGIHLGHVDQHQHQSRFDHGTPYAHV